MVDPISKDQAMQELGDITNLLSMPGWAVIKDEGTKRIQAAYKKLGEADASKIYEVMELQHQIKALEWVLSWPADWAEQLSKFEKDSAQEIEPES